VGVFLLPEPPVGAYLLERGILPYAILAVTFTRKAATAMRKRVEALLDTPPQGLTVSTLHSLGYRILRENGYILQALVSGHGP
jgi:ATP-dependent DNA helicase Rep